LSKAIRPFFIIITVTIIGVLLLAVYLMVAGPGGNGGRYVMSEEDMPVTGELEARLRRHVFSLADEIGERNIFARGSLQKAASCIRSAWEEVGYDIRAQRYTLENTECENLSVEIPGGISPGEIVLVGAHYDTVLGSPGANDNGSAVAALLEISRLFNNEPRDRTVRFVAFVNEEPPFFRTGSMGSRIYARACRERGEEISAMVCLETIGYYSDKKGSQQYPLPFGFFYPDKGNFIAVVGNLKSRPLVNSFVRFFTEESDFPIESVVSFSWIPGIDWSDHGSFWAHGYPAIMITDTALYRYPYYHTPSDTPDKLDYTSLARVTHGIYKAVERLAEGDDARETMDDGRWSTDD